MAGNLGNLSSMLRPAIEAVAKSPLGILLAAPAAVMAYLVFSKVPQRRTQVRNVAVLFAGIVLYASALAWKATASLSPGNSASSDGGLHIRGQVIDDHNTPVLGVLVTSADGAAPTMTDSSGIFDITIRLPPGQVSTLLRFFASGYASADTLVRPPIGSLEIMLSSTGAWRRCRRGRGPRISASKRTPIPRAGLAKRSARWVASGFDLPTTTLLFAGRIRWKTLLQTCLRLWCLPA